MSSLNTLRLPDGTELNLSEWLHWPIYSNILVGAGDAVNLAAFSYSVSQTVPHTAGIAARVATENDTNLIRRRRMGQDEAIVVYAITYDLFGETNINTADTVPHLVAMDPMAFGTDIRRLQRDCVVELIVGAGIKKPQVECPFSYIPQAIGATAYTSGDGGSGPQINVHYGTGGTITPRNQRTLNLPVYIGGFGENARPGNSMFFILKFKAPAGPIAGIVQDFAIRWWLDSLKKRPA